MFSRSLDREVSISWTELLSKYKRVSSAYTSLKTSDRGCNMSSRKTDFRKLKITLVSMTYHNQRPQCPSLSPHVLLNFAIFKYNSSLLNF